MTKDKQQRLLFTDITRCMACHNCELACAVAHSASKALVEAITEEPRPSARLSIETAGEMPVPLQCRQCQDAPCMVICPTHALYRADDESPVVIDHDKCIGCTWCVLACPFGVITVDAGGRMVVKCDQCFERVGRGELPACVSACPTKALTFTSLEEVVAGKRDESLLRIERALAGEDA